ncbi:hypothetical protein [Dapis sp. BLCC M126]
MRQVLPDIRVLVIHQQLIFLTGLFKTYTILSQLVVCFGGEKNLPP